MGSALYSLCSKLTKQRSYINNSTKGYCNTIRCISILYTLFQNHKGRNCVKKCREKDYLAVLLHPSLLAKILKNGIR